MLVSFGILGMVQLLRHNINAKGNLKKPVPFIPYIALAFLLLWIWNKLLRPDALLPAEGLLTFSENNAIVMPIKYTF